MRRWAFLPLVGLCALALRVDSQLAVVPPSTISGVGGAALGGLTTTTLSITDTARPAPAATYYIDCTGGNDDNDGLTSDTAWKSPSRFNDVPASASGHVMARLLTSPCINPNIAPTIGGLDEDHRKIICADSTTNIELRASPAVAEAIIATGNVSYVSIGTDFRCPSTGRIALNGQCTPQKGGPSTGCGITRGGSIGRTGANVGWEIDIDHNSTEGWVGWFVGNPSGAPDRIRFMPNTSIHGTPFVGDGQDSGDTFWIDRRLTTATALLFSGGNTWRTLRGGGHSLLHVEGGKVLGWGLIFGNSWAGVAGFSGVNPDGNRAIEPNKFQTGMHLHDFIVNRNGKPADQSWVEWAKWEGTSAAYTNCVIRNTQGWGLLAESRSGTEYAQGGRMAHCVWDRAGGPIFYLSDRAGSGDPGRGSLHGYKIKNNVFLRLNQNDECCNSGGNWDDLVGVIDLSGTSLDFRNVIQEFAYNTIEIPSGDCADLFLTVYGGSPQVDTISLAQLQRKYPAQWHDNTCTTDANMDNAPAPSADLTGSNYLAAYTPVNDKISTGTGGALTTATAGGIRSRSLQVADATWFPDPSPHDTWTWGAPLLGQWAGAYQVHIEGVGNVTYTNVQWSGSYPTVSGTLTLASAQTWSSGADVNFSISAGLPNSTPNRGVKRRRRPEPKPRRRL